MQDLFGYNEYKVKGELAELGVFPVGGRWPDEKSIYIRTRPSLAAFPYARVGKEPSLPSAQANSQ